MKLRFVENLAVKDITAKPFFLGLLIYIYIYICIYQRKDCFSGQLQYIMQCKCMYVHFQIMFKNASIEFQINQIFPEKSDAFHFLLNSTRMLKRYYFRV